ncbi:hypothetical protein K439DRAFT_1639485 [Ramaria rubella]|nr:hypothetical protein K439DRAFT_1639485 [Ramaria rubella]
MMRAFAIGLLFSCFLGLSKASPLARAFTGCDVSNDIIPLPSGLTAPTDAKPIFIAVGLGTQNYSCNAAGTFTSIGAVATLLDASCVFNIISAIANKDSEASIAIDAVTAALGSSPLVLGHHYFVDNPTGAAGVSPTFDFRADSEKGNPNAFVITAKTGDIPAPTNPTTNVDWLSLAAIPGQGELASNVFRIFTLGGQPPSSCTPGSAPITVPYAANYWFFK